MMGLPSRQTAQRDLTSHSRLKLRRTRNAEEEETPEEKLKRLKRELEEREKKGSVAVTSSSIPPLAQIKIDAFDDADEEDDSSSSEDEEAPQVKRTDTALQKELERVRLEKKLKAEQTISGAMVSSNPLLEKTPIQRRWDDDVIFRNQARGEPDKKEKRYVNDIVRSDVHKDFLKKHIL